MTETENTKIKNQKQGGNWDGSSEGRESWVAIVAKSLERKGTEKAGLWFTSRAIQERLRAEGHEVVPKIALVMGWLIKRGYIERARSPKGVNEWGRVPYLYRRTKKAYSVPVMLTGSGKGKGRVVDRKGMNIFHNNRRLPKWFRDMMK